MLSYDLSLTIGSDVLPMPIRERQILDLWKTDIKNRLRPELSNCQYFCFVFGDMLVKKIKNLHFGVLALTVLISNSAWVKALTRKSSKLDLWFNTLLCFATVYVPNNFYRPIFIKYYSTMSSINIVWSVNQLPKTITILHFRVYANKRTINSANGFELLVVQTWIVMFVISFPKNIDAS